MDWFIARHAPCGPASDAEWPLRLTGACRPSTASGEESKPGARRRAGRARRRAPLRVPASVATRRSPRARALRPPATMATTWAILSCASGESSGRRAASPGRPAQVGQPGVRIDREMGAPTRHLHRGPPAPLAPTRRRAFRMPQHHPNRKAASPPRRSRRLDPDRHRRGRQCRAVLIQPPRQFGDGRNAAGSPFWVATARTTPRSPTPAPCSSTILCSSAAVRSRRGALRSGRGSRPGSTAPAARR